MGHRIRLVPSGREFTAETQETVLEAALRHGVNLPYNCSGGSCGACKARLLTGEIAAARFHDFVFSEAEKTQGSVLLCSIGAGSDMVLEVREIGTAEEVQHQSLNARVARIERPAENYVVLTLRTPRSQALQFLAGQHVELKLGGELICDAAIASCPCNGMYLQFHLARRDDTFSRHVFERIHLGDVVVVEGPFGTFTLDEHSPRPLVMVAQDIGFAPLKSLLEHGMALELPQALTLIWVSAYADGHYMANLCRSWVDAMDNFSFQPLLLEPGGEAALAGVIAGAVVDAAGSDFYLAVDDELCKPLYAALLARNAADERIFVMEKRKCGR